MNRAGLAWRGGVGLAVALCWASVALAQTGRLSGHVKDASTSKPIKGATIIAENPLATPSSFTAVSDEKGRFAVLGLRAGNWMVTVSAPSYATVRGTARIQSFGNNPPLAISLQSAPQSSPSVFDGVDPAALQRELDAAEQALNESRYADAIAAYTAIAEKVPSLTLAVVQVARAQRLGKHFDEAAATLDQALSQDPGSVMARYERALVERDRGDLDAAERWLTEAAERDDTAAHVLCALGDVHREKGRPDVADRWYSKARDAAPDWSTPYLKLGLLAAERGRTEEAIALLNKALTLAPEGADAVAAGQALAALRK
jgi:Flp pilus assembly protein TadD